MSYAVLEDVQPPATKSDYHHCLCAFTLQFSTRSLAQATVLVLQKQQQTYATTYKFHLTVSIFRYQPTVLHLRWLITGFSPWKLGFNPGAIHVEDELALQQYPKHFPFPLPIIIAPFLYCQGLVQYVRRFSAAPSIQVARGNLNSS
jgi:hypothetical protein